MRKLETYFIPEINSAFSQDDPPSLHGRFWNYSKLSPAFDAELNTQECSGLCSGECAAGSRSR
jgi:hypothetical protein